MQVHFGVGALSAEWPSSVACIGTFDGVHVGHRAVISDAVRVARQSDQPCVLVTFDRHPASVLHPGKQPKSLSSLEDNLVIFNALGVSVALILAFDEGLSHMSAQEFLDKILIGVLKAKALVVGHDFAMGRDRVGDGAWLSQHIPTRIVPAFEIDGARVSSSHIRSAVLAGDMELAKRLLGRPYSITGVVVPGLKLGRQLGYPTANIGRSVDSAVPADGVYAGRMKVGDTWYVAAIAIGLRPAIGGTARTIEAYLLDYPGDSLYGLSCRVEFLGAIREERDFPSLEDLTKQMAIDIENVRAVVQSAG